MASLIHWRAALALGALFVAGTFACVIFTQQALKEDTCALTRKSASSDDAAPTRLPPADKREVRPSQMTAVLIAYLATFILSFTWSGFLSTAIPPYAGEVVGVSTSTLGMVLTAGLLVDLALMLPLGWLSDRLDYRVVLAPAMLLMALPLAWFPQAQGLCGLLVVSIGVHTSFVAWVYPRQRWPSWHMGSACAAPWGCIAFWSMGRWWWLHGSSEPWSGGMALNCGPGSPLLVCC